MAVHFLHTSDWHLGQFFHHHEREYEHTEFLNWLLTQIKSKQPNALLIAGDILMWSILLRALRNNSINSLPMRMCLLHTCKP